MWDFGLKFGGLTGLHGIRLTFSLTTIRVTCFVLTNVACRSLKQYISSQHDNYFHHKNLIMVDVY